MGIINIQILGLVPHGFADEHYENESQSMPSSISSLSWLSLSGLLVKAKKRVIDLIGF